MISANNLAYAVNILNRGGIIIFPTDTAFGIGCRMDNEKAIARLFKIRKRPEDKAVPVLVSGISMAQTYLTPLSNNVRRLMKNYWPGALTVIYPAKIDMTPPLVRGGGNTLGVRMPDHEIALKIIKACNVPILAPSANFHKGKTPYKFSQLDPELIKLVDYVLEGEGKLDRISTVIDCTKKTWKIVRQGAVILDLDKYE